jgi:hypothetical protein
MSSPTLPCRSLRQSRSVRAIRPNSGGVRVRRKEADERAIPSVCLTARGTGMVGGQPQMTIQPRARRAFGGFLTEFGRGWGAVSRTFGFSGLTMPSKCQPLAAVFGLGQ